MSRTTRISILGGAEGAPTRRGTALHQFSVHYLQMVVAMVAGMAILGPLESLLLALAGRESVLDHPIVNAMTMATNMTVAMAGWMRFRGHRWAPVRDMSLAMYLPFLVLLLPLWPGAIGDRAFVVSGHVLMLLGMLLAMLLRPEEYTGH